jgi:hypothetical protein
VVGCGLDSPPDDGAGDSVTAPRPDASVVDGGADVDSSGVVALDSTLPDTALDDQSAPLQDVAYPADIEIPPLPTGSATLSTAPMLYLLTITDDGYVIYIKGDNTGPFYQILAQKSDGLSAPIVVMPSLRLTGTETFFARSSSFGLFDQCSQVGNDSLCRLTAWSLATGAHTYPTPVLSAAIDVSADGKTLLYAPASSTTHHQYALAGVDFSQESTFFIDYNCPSPTQTGLQLAGSRVFVAVTCPGYSTLVRVFSQPDRSDASAPLEGGAVLDAGTDAQGDGGLSPVASVSTDVFAIDPSGRYLAYRVAIDVIYLAVHIRDLDIGADLTLPGGYGASEICITAGGSVFLVDKTLTTFPIGATSESAVHVAGPANGLLGCEDDNAVFYSRADTYDGGLPPTSDIFIWSSPWTSDPSRISSRIDSYYLGTNATHKRRFYSLNAALFAWDVNTGSRQLTPAGTQFAVDNNEGIYAIAGSLSQSGMLEFFDLSNQSSGRPIAAGANGVLFDAPRNRVVFAAFDTASSLNTIYSIPAF